MKYSVLGFNQELVMNTDLDLTDLMLLQYILNACGSPKMRHILDSNERPMVWLQHKKLSEDLPILRISEGTLRNRLVKLRQGGYIDSKTIATDSMRGTKTYYGITEITMSLIYDMDDTTASRKNDVIDRPCHSKMTSDNLLIDNNKLNNTIPNGIVDEPSSDSETELSDFEKHMNEDDVRKRRKIVQSDSDKPKQKRMSLWDKCVQEIEHRYPSEDFQALLQEYLKIRLAMKDKPIYGLSQWKGLLNKLETFQPRDREAIVKQSIELGYASFYELRGNRKQTTSNPQTFGENCNNKSVKVTQEEREEMMKNGKAY